MADQTEKINRIMTIVTVLWLCLLCILIVFSLPIFPITICATGTFCKWIFILSLGLAAFNFIRVKTDHLALEILCVVLAFPFLGAILNPFSVIHNPFTSQQFASNSEINFLYKGSITYYRKAGILLYSPQESEYGEFSRDSDFVSVSCNQIYVNSTFMGPGADYQIDNAHINLGGKNIDKFILYKESHTRTECFELTEDVLLYRSNYKEEKRLLTQAEYNKMRNELKKMTLVEEETYHREGNQDRYRLSVEIRNDDSSYYANVDGQKLYDSFSNFMVSDGL